MPPPFDLLPLMLRGLTITVQLTVASALLAFFISFVAGIARSSTLRIIRILASSYIEFFRGTSVLVQMFWIFFVFPLPPFNMELSAFQSGVLALGLNVGAYGAEIVRGAIQAVPAAQIEAAVALNMAPSLIMRRVVLPQALVRIIPPFGNLLIELLKLTSLASLITLSDLTFQATILRSTMGRTSEIFFVLLLLYFALAYPLSLGVRWLEKRRQWA